MQSAIGYLRVSTREQGRSGLGLSAQRSEIEAFGAKEGISDKSWYQDVQTGAGSDALLLRPGLAAALKAAKSARCSLIVARLDRLSRNVHFSERYIMNFAVDAFNVPNRPNVDEVTSVYGSPVFCGGIPQHYNDALTRAIQQGSAAASCPVGNLTNIVPSFVGSFATTPIGTNLFIPARPNANFGLPRTALNPRQLQFSVRFNF